MTKLIARLSYRIDDEDFEKNQAIQEVTIATHTIVKKKDNLYKFPNEFANMTSGM